MPALASNPAWELIVKDPPETVWLLICLLIIKLEFEVSTFEIIFLGNFENIPEFSMFNTLGTLILKMGSNLQGKVLIQKLIVESGAIFNASCSMHSAEDGVKKLKNVDEKEKQADESLANIL